MNKEIYLVGGTSRESYSSFRDRMLTAASEITSVYHPEKMWITITTEPPPALSVIPFKKGRIAAFTLVRSPEAQDPCTLLTGIDGFRNASRVEEAVPVSYNRNWPDGEVTPGICMLTLFRSKPGITHDRFIDRWHNSHTPLSLRIHPLWHYNRNVVTETIYSTEPAWGGIVEEHFNPRSQLLNPLVFFAKTGMVIPNMIRVYNDINTFIDTGSMEVWLVREYHIRSH